jgi:hypothetical protein
MLSASGAYHGIPTLQIGNTDICWIRNGLTCFLRVINDSRWQREVLLESVRHHWPGGVRRCPPDTDHVQHTEQHTVQTRQYARVLENGVNGRKPLDKAVLRRRRGLTFALAQGAHNSNNDIAWHSLGGVQILDQGGNGGLI